MQGELPSNHGGFDIEYDGIHVGQLGQVMPEMLVKHSIRVAASSNVTVFAALIEQQGSATESTEQKLGKRSILATIPERYCHVGVHTAGAQILRGIHHIKVHRLRSTA